MILDVELLDEEGITFARASRFLTLKEYGVIRPGFQVTLKIVIDVTSMSQKDAESARVRLFAY